MAELKKVLQEIMAENFPNGKRHKSTDSKCEQTQTGYTKQKYVPRHMSNF